ncbi:hypothetical protein IDH28_03920 [Pelagibacterales bacterium SAG-MED31]|nr:hypothetical protein [Pelagibacterales bacterium SAG-MED31]
MNKTNKILISLNVIFLIYYSIQLLIFTDEFSYNNLGSFNHAIAGLSEIIGIIFLSLAIALILIIRNKTRGQFPIFFTIFLIQLLIFINFLRYIFSNSPGETSIESITFNAFIFFLGLIVSIFFLVKNYTNLKQF